MIKLIATDIDGTLLPEGEHGINPEMFEVIRELKDKGVVFAAASGRQYPSMRKLFEPVHHDMIFVSENGAYVNCRGVDIFEDIIEKSIMDRMVRQVRELDDCILVAGNKKATYLETSDEAFIDLLVNGFQNDIVVVDDLTKAEGDFIKLSIYREDGVDGIAELLIPQWEQELKVAIAGKSWLDFTNKDTDKGRAIREIQRVLRIEPEETMVFGDNYNDLGMFASAGESYAVKNARSEVRAAAKHIADENINDGVLKVMKSLLNQ